MKFIKLFSTAGFYLTFYLFLFVQLVKGDDVDSSILNNYLFYCSKAAESIGSDSILYYSSIAIDLAEKYKIDDQKAIILHGQGNLQSGDVADALKNFFTAAELYEKKGNFIGLATAYGYVAATYIQQNNNTNANHYLKLAINIFENEKDSLRWAYALHNLAFNYYTQDYKLDSSLYYFSRSKGIFDRLDVEIESAYCTGNSGLVFYKLANIEKAEQNLLKAIEILQKFDDSYAYTEFMVIQANILQQKGELTKAIEYALRCYRISLSNGLSERIRDITRNLAEFYQEKKQFDSAYYFHKIYVNYNDSLKNIETVQKLADLRTSYEVSQKQAEVDRLEGRRIFYMVVIGSLILIVLLAFGLIYMYYLNLRRARKFTKKLEKQGKELQNSNQVKDKFFSIISHDLRSPISALSAISIMINESLEYDNKEILIEASDYIDKTVFSLTALLENLLNWAMSEQDKFPYSFEDIDLKELISVEVRTLATIAISKSINLKLQLDDNLVIIGDNNSLKTIVRNLLSNAYKFTPKNGKVTINAKKTDHNLVEISVADTGVGIAEEKLSDIFELKADKSTRGTNKEKGLGLGLTLIHEFVCKNNGNISVKSKLNAGTTFTINFPLKS